MAATETQRRQGYIRGRVEDAGCCDFEERWVGGANVERERK
jgi:hypothetical protein